LSSASRSGLSAKTALGGARERLPRQFSNLRRYRRKQQGQPGDFVVVKAVVCLQRRRNRTRTRQKLRSKRKLATLASRSSWSVERQPPCYRRRARFDARQLSPWAAATQRQLRQNEPTVNVAAEQKQKPHGGVRDQFTGEPGLRWFETSFIDCFSRPQIQRTERGAGSGWRRAIRSCWMTCRKDRRSTSS